MKRSLLTLLLTFTLATAACAGTRIEADQLPQAVAETLEAYFPDSEVLQAERERGDRYEVKIRYKDIRLEVDLDADGKVLDVEMND